MYTNTYVLVCIVVVQYTGIEVSPSSRYFDDPPPPHVLSMRFAPGTIQAASDGFHVRSLSEVPNLVNLPCELENGYRNNGFTH